MRNVGTGEQSRAGATRLRGKATVKPDYEEAGWYQHDPGQLHGEIAKLVVKFVLGDEVRL